MNNVDISVILPVYNTGEYLKECLDSLLRQGDVRLQVILIDDGSTDNSGEIAESYCRKYSWFEYHRVTNGGPGRARNIGVKYATGKYIQFVDSDDMLADGILARMLLRAKCDDSDLVICNVCHFDAFGYWDSRLHKKVFSRFRRITNIRENHDLLYDTTIWNKLIRKDFYDDCGFIWPEDMFFEDIPVATEMHCHAEKVSVINTTGYYWRVREGENRSTTQKATDIRYMKDRIKALQMLDDYFYINVSDSRLEVSKQFKTINTDFKVYIRKFPDMEPALAQRYMALINEYTEKAVDLETFNRLRVFDRQMYRYTRENDLDGLLRLLAYKDYNNAPVTERDGRFYADLPDDLFTIPDRDITYEIREKEPQQRISSVKINSDQLEITADFYIERVNIENVNDQTVTAYLYSEATGKMTELECLPFSDSELTEVEGLRTDMSRRITTFYNYDGTGVIIKADLSDKKLISDHIGSNLIVVDINNRITSRTFAVSCGVENMKRYDGIAKLIGDTGVSISCSAPGTVVIEIDKEPVVLEKLISDKRGAGLQLNRKVDNLRVLCSDTSINDAFDPGDGKEFYLKTDGPDGFRGSLHYVSKCGQGTTEGIVYARQKYSEASGTGKRVLAVGGISGRGTQIISDDISVILTGIKKAKDKYMIDTGIYYEGEIPDEAILIAEDNTLGTVVMSRAVPEADEKGLTASFIVDIDLRKARTELFDICGDMYVEIRRRGETVRKSRVYCFEQCSKHLRFSDITVIIKRTGYLNLQFQIIANNKQRLISKEVRRSIIANKYPEFLKEPLSKDMILFKNTGRAGRSSIEWMLYEFFTEYYPEIKCVWAVRESGIPLGEDSFIVRIGSEEYYKILARAGTVITDKPLSEHYVQREGQELIETYSIGGSDGSVDRKMMCEKVEDIVIKNRIKKVIRRCIRSI